jgi:AcrR family transcriptional regulator
MSDAEPAVRSEPAAPDLYYRRPTQARGIEKFEKILDATHALLESRGIDAFSLYDVAKHAKVAAGSVYHFFPNLEAAFIALVERYDQRFAEICSRPIPAGEIDTWEDILLRHFENSRKFINDHPPAMVLIIGPGRTWASKQVDTLGDTRIAQAMLSSFEQHFLLPESPRPDVLLHYTIRMLEGFWELSYQQHGYVTDELSLETNRAAIAYLGLYWPRYLPRVDT